MADADASSLQQHALHGGVCPSTNSLCVHVPGNLYSAITCAVSALPPIKNGGTTAVDELELERAIALQLGTLTTLMDPGTP